MNSKRIIVYSLEQARAAIEAGAILGVPVTLMSARGMASFMGPLWFKAVIEEAGAARPDVPLVAVLDCADEPGTALGALRAGFKLVRFSGPEETRQRLDDIAGQMGAAVEGEMPFDGLDLLETRDALGACRAFLPPD